MNIFAKKKVFQNFQGQFPRLIFTAKSKEMPHSIDRSREMLIILHVSERKKLSSWFEKKYKLFPNFGARSTKF